MNSIEMETLSDAVPMHVVFTLEVEESLEELSQCMKEALETLHDDHCNSTSHDTA
jgi:hypothetical protein